MSNYKKELDLDDYQPPAKADEPKVGAVEVVGTVEVVGVETSLTWNDTIGVDDSDLSGLSRSIDTLASPAFQQALARRISQQRPVQRQPPTKARPFAMSFRETIQPGQVASVRNRSYSLFRVDNHVVTETVPGATRILGVFVGNRCQFGPGFEIPTNLVEKTGVKLVNDTIQVGIDVMFNVRNDAQVPVVWECYLNVMEI